MAFNIKYDLSNLLLMRLKFVFYNSFIHKVPKSRTPLYLARHRRKSRLSPNTFMP